MEYENSMRLCKKSKSALKNIYSQTPTGHSRDEQNKVLIDKWSLFGSQFYVIFDQGIVIEVWPL